MASRATGGRFGEKGGLGRYLALIGKTKLLEDEFLPGGGEVWRRVGVRDVVGDTGEAGVEAAKEVEDKLRDNDSIADITQGIIGGLHLLAEVMDGEVTLSHRVEFVT